MVVSANIDGTAVQVAINLWNNQSVKQRFCATSTWSEWMELNTFNDSGFIPVTSFDISGVIDNSGGVGTGYRKKNGYVTVTVNLNGVGTLPNHATNILFTLPEGYRPTNDIYTSCFGFNTGNAQVLSIHTNGQVVIKTFENVGVLVGTITFPA